jgi:plasmid maintenance system antidote protein VapI
MVPPVSDPAIVREVLRRFAGGKALRDLDRKMDKSPNYVSRVLRGKIDLTFALAFEIVKAAGHSPATFLRALADEIDHRRAPRGAEGAETQLATDEAIGSVRDAQGLNRRLLELEQRVEDVEARLPLSSEGS